MAVILAVVRKLFALVIFAGSFHNGVFQINRRIDMNNKVLSFAAKTISALIVATTIIVGYSSDAHAVTKSGCTVTGVQYDNNRLAVWCANDSQIYYAFNYATGTCAQSNITTMKIWLSMFQSALLSGRPVDFQYDNSTTTCSVRIINWGVKLR